MTLATPEKMVLLAATQEEGPKGIEQGKGPAPTGRSHSCDFRQCHTPMRPPSVALLHVLSLVKKKKIKVVMKLCVYTHTYSIYYHRYYI